MDSRKQQRQQARDEQMNRRRVGIEVESKENLHQDAVMRKKQELQRWREERTAKRLAEQRSQRPVFRCGRVRTAPSQPDLPPLKDTHKDKGYQHVCARVDTGLKSMKPTINFAITSTAPAIFGGNINTNRQPSGEDTRKPNRKVHAKEPSKGNNKIPPPSRRRVSKDEQKTTSSAAIDKTTKVIAKIKPITEKPKDEEISTTDGPETPKQAQEQPTDALQTPRRFANRKSIASAAKLNVTPETAAPVAEQMDSNVAAISDMTTPANRTIRPRKTPGSRMKRAAPEDEDDQDLMTDDDSFTLGCTPSGKVRRIANGQALPVIRKSFEILKLKTTEERVAALMQSPMVEFRKRRSVATADVSSPYGASILSEEDQARREERLEMRAEVMQKVAADYAKSPEAHIEDGSPLRQLDPASAQKVRRKSRILQEAFASTAQKSGQPVTALSAHHFRCLLSDETARLEELRSTFEPLSYSINIASNVQAEIAAVIGQTELLFRHKFFFYEQMIAKHENGVSGGRGALEGRLVTAEDLLGYWELMRLEVDNLDARYKQLSQWEKKGWAGTLADLEQGAPESGRKPLPPRKKIVKAKRVVKKPVTSKFAAFRAQMKKKSEGDDSTTELEQRAQSEEAEVKPAINITPPTRSHSGAPLRSALKSAVNRKTPAAKEQRKSFAAVRFAAASCEEPQEHTPNEAKSGGRRQLTPYNDRRVSGRRSAAAAVGVFASPQRRPLRSRSASLRGMPASPRATTPTSEDVAGRPQTGTPFPEARASSGSRRRIADLRSSAGLSLRTEEARRQSSSCSPPTRRVGRCRQSSVRFNESPEGEPGSITMPMTPYNRNSLVPMTRRSRASSAPRSKASSVSSSSSASSSASTSACRVRFDSDTYSPPADQPSAPVTPFSKDSLVPLPRRQRQSNAVTPQRTEGDGDIQETITPPLTPRLVDVTPLRRSARRRTTNAGDTPAADGVNLL